MAYPVQSYPGQIVNIPASGMPSHTHEIQAPPWPGHELISAWDRLLTPLGMIAARLNVRPGEMCPFAFINAHRIDDEKVVVFIVHGNEPLVLTDDGKLFPSDGLITQLRLLITK